MKKNKIKKLMLPLYNYPFVLYIGSYRDYHAHINKKYQLNEDVTKTGYREGCIEWIQKEKEDGTYDIDFYFFLKVVLFKKGHESFLRKVVIHESSHLADYFMEHFNLPVNRENTEIKAVFTSEIAELVFDEIYKL